jgi:hypothetical protein
MVPILLLSNPSIRIGEAADYDKVIARYKSEKLGDNWSQNMKIVPVNFNTGHKAMLGHCKMILETDGGRIAINPDRFDKLITALRTAVDNEGTLDKEATSYNDIFEITTIGKAASNHASLRTVVPMPIVRQWSLKAVEIITPIGFYPFTGGRFVKGFSYKVVLSYLAVG